MSVTDVSRVLRLLLQDSPDAPSLSTLLNLVNNVVHECSSSQTPAGLISQLENELQITCKDLDRTVCAHIEIFLAVLFHLRSILPPSSLISTWFDLILRPALREPKLSDSATNHAKELIITALQPESESATDVENERPRDMVGEFRRRLMDLYVLDAYNDSSGDDVLEWAQLDEKERSTMACWKTNLEDVLVKAGLQRPQDLFQELHLSFLGSPSSRLQLLVLLNTLTSKPTFPEDAAAVLAAHPLILSLIYSLLLDTSSTACTIGLTIFTKLLPIFAVKACEDLKRLLPQLYAILARVICWRERPFTSSAEELDLELTFDGTASPPPEPTPYFTFLYYLFPLNTIRFLRTPVEYLETSNVERVYAARWEDVLDEGQIRSRSEALLRGHVLHPLLILRDAEEELSQPDFWEQFDVAKIVSGCTMLDARNAAIAQNGDADEQQPQTQTQEGRVRVSLQDMLATSVALKSGQDLEIEHPTSTVLLQQLSARSLIPSSEVAVSAASEDEVPNHVIQAISALQREVLLLRSELNFELWMTRENVRHIGRLYHDRVQSKSAEFERQGLHNKMREYKAEISRLQQELKEHKDQSAMVKNQYADWNRKLQDKLKDFRAEKTSWNAEAAAIRTAEKEIKESFVAQGNLLAEASSRVFQLETKIKENAHKVDRFQDYEKQIDQFVKLQRLWELDVNKLKEQDECLRVFDSRYKKMELELQTYRATQAEMEEYMRLQRSKMQTLESRLLLSQKQLAAVRQHVSIGNAARSREDSSQLSRTNERLREENDDLREEVEELKAMVELLKGQVSGRQGVISEPQSAESPSLRAIASLTPA